MECLKELEALQTRGAINLYYGDESGFCTEGYVPYGWQFQGECISVPAQKRANSRLNCFAMISRQSICHWQGTPGSITGAWLADYLDRFSNTLIRKTVIVLDCAALHRCKAIKERLAVWRRRGLWLFYLPSYSPHLNLCETLWRMAKTRWLAAEDYINKDRLHYSVTSILNAVGNQVTIKFKPDDAN